MRYVAFFLLLLLSLYFLFLKPYLASKRVLYGVEDLSFRASPPYLEVGSLYVYLPLGERYIFLSLKDLSVSYEEKLKLSLSEGTFISVGKASGGKGKGRIKLPIPEFLKESELKVGRFLITIVGDRAVSVLLREVALKGRRLKGSAEIHTGNLITFVSLDRAYLGEKAISVKRARVWSDLFDLSIRGSVREEDLEASFTLEGRVNEIKRGAVRIDPVRIRGSGKLDYEGLRIQLEGFTGNIKLENRLDLGNVRTDSELVVLFGERSYLKGRVWNEITSLNYELSLSPDMRLMAKVENFPADSKLLGVPYLILAWVRGDILYDFEEKKLELSAGTDSLSVEGFNFGRASVRLSYDLGNGKGNLSLKASKPGFLLVSGEFDEKGFEGRLELDRLFLAEGPLSLCISYRGKVAYTDSLQLSGEGNFMELSYSNFPVGDGSYSLNLNGNRLELVYAGKGFSGFVKGSFRGNILSITELRDLRREIYGFGIYVSDGRVEFSSAGDKFVLGISVSAGRFEREGIGGTFSSKLKISKEDKLEGIYLLKFDDLQLPSRKVTSALLEGKIRGKVAEGTYRADEVLEGDYRLDVEKKLLSTRGSLNLEGVKLRFDFQGTPEKGKLEWSGEIGEPGKPVGLTGKGSYERGTYLLEVYPAVYEKGAFRFSFGGLKIRGNLERASLNLEDIRVSILGRPALKLSQREGALDIKGRRLLWKGDLEGALDGKLEVRYSEGISIFSEGFLDLDRLSFFIATPVGGKAEGKLRYSLSYRDGYLDLELKNAGKVVTYSRFFSFPLEAWVDLRAVGRSLAAFITLWRDDSGLSANVGTLNLRDYYVYLVSRDLPVSYRTDGLNISLKVSSEGWVDVKDLKNVRLRLDALLNGDIEIGKLKKEKKDRSNTPAVELDVRFESDRPVRILLPEGHIYANVRGWVAGSSADPRYGIEVELLSGELKYFGRTFFVKGGTINSLKDGEEESARVDITLVSPGDELSVFLKVRGDMEDPQVVVWSEPPRSTQELLTKLIIGSTAEGVIPVAKALFKQLGYIGNLRSGLTSLLGVDISFSTQTGSQGEIGFGVNVRKKIARAFAIEYQQSTLKDPRATYYGGSLSISRNFSFYGRVFSDRSSEIKLRFIRKFDF